MNPRDYPDQRTTRRRAKVRPSTALVLLLTAVTVAACPGEPDSPEKQIRALIAKAESAAEEKDLGTLKDLISEAYAGRDGETRRDLVRVIGYYLLHNKSIHLFAQIRRIEFPEPRRAEATIFVAMAGRHIEAVSQLSGLRADIYRVDSGFADEGDGDWRVTRTEWRQADTTDLAEED